MDDVSLCLVWVVAGSGEKPIITAGILAIHLFSETETSFRRRLGVPLCGLGIQGMYAGFCDLVVKVRVRLKSPLIIKVKASKEKNNEEKGQKEKAVSFRKRLNLVVVVF